MGFSAATTLQNKWPLFVKYGATKSCVYREMAGSTYSGGNVSKAITSSTNLEIIFDKVVASLVDGSTILVIDRVAIFPALNLPVVPKINDVIVDPSLREWEVKDVVEDPVDAHFELRVRPVGFYVAPPTTMPVGTFNGVGDFILLDDEWFIAGDFVLKAQVIIDSLLTDNPIFGSRTTDHEIGINATTGEIATRIDGTSGVSGLFVSVGEISNIEIERIGTNAFVTLNGVKSEAIGTSGSDYRVSYLGRGWYSDYFTGIIRDVDKNGTLISIDEGEGIDIHDSNSNIIGTLSTTDLTAFWANTIEL